MSRLNSSDNFIITSACACNKGLRRHNNEDNFYFDGEYMEINNDGLDHVLTCMRKVSGNGEDDGCFFAVFDGMGGCQYGEAASFTAASMTKVFMDQHVPDDYSDTSEMLREMCLLLNDDVFRESEARQIDLMASTLVGCYFYEGRVWCCNVGDSKCCRIRSGILEQLSSDHTDAEEMKITGVTGRKPYVTQFLGADRRNMMIRPAVYSGKIQNDDIFIICSDGLTDMVSSEKVKGILLGDTDEEEKAQALLVEALKNGGRDNITVIVCRVREV